MLINLLASVTAGAVSNTLTAPIWTIRTRMMTQINHDDYRNSLDAAVKIYRKEGLYALYRGVVPSMWGLVSDERTSSVRVNVVVSSGFFRFTLAFNFRSMNI